MRDPKRIEKVLNTLRAYWQTYPDLRLGQVVANAAMMANPECHSDPFYIEDDKMVESLVKMIYG